jgi:hypothetical protein
MKEINKEDYENFNDFTTKNKNSFIGFEILETRAICRNETNYMPTVIFEAHEKACMSQYDNTMHEWINNIGTFYKFKTLRDLFYWIRTGKPRKQKVKKYYYKLDSINFCAEKCKLWKSRYIGSNSCEINCENCIKSNQKKGWIKCREIDKATGAEK